MRKEPKPSDLLYLSVVDFFDAFPEIKAGPLAAAAGLGSVIYQYKNEAAPMSEERRRQIEQAIHALGHNLLCVRIK